jgi:hypothetical protein
MAPSFQVFDMYTGKVKEYIAATRIDALLLAAEFTYGCIPDKTRIVTGKHSYGYIDLAIPFKTSCH